MGNINRCISAYIITLLVFTGILYSQEQPVEETEVVQEKAQFKIEDAYKPGLFKLPPIFSPVDSMIETKESKLFLQISNVSETFFRDAIKLKNPYIRKPLPTSLFADHIEIPVKKPRHKVVSWKFLIISYEMDTVKIFEGKGKLPKVLTWDGKTPSGIIKILTPYSLLLKYTDEFGRKRRVFQGDIMVEGFKSRIDNELIAMFSIDSMFEKGTERLNEKGKLAIEELSNMIKENYKESFTIKVKVKTGFLYVKRSDVIEKEFRKRLPYPEEKVKVEKEFIGREEIPLILVTVR